jgi:hypothetical protein
MRILFYSNKCNFCLKLMEYLTKNNLKEFFKIICIDNTTNIPANIQLVPTIIDTEIEAPLEGKKAFEYIINQKYFNCPTNNIELTKNGVPKPTIDEDTKAVSSKSSGFIYVNKDIENKYINKEDKNNFDNVFGFNKNNNNNKIIENNQLNNIMNQRNIDDKKINALLRLRGK